MSVAELIPTVEALPDAEKFQLLQYLVTELGKQAGYLPLNPNMVYPIWTPYHVPADTVAKLADMLVQEQVNHVGQA